MNLNLKHLKRQYFLKINFLFSDHTDLRFTYCVLDFLNWKGVLSFRKTFILYLKFAIIKCLFNFDSNCYDFLRKAMDSGREFRFSSLPTFAKPSCGRHFHPRLWTPDAAPSLRAPLSRFSTCWLRATTRCALSARRFTARTCLTWWIWWPPSSCLLLSYTFRWDFWRLIFRLNIFK